MSTTGAVEAFVPLNGSAGNSAPITGGRRRKLKLVTRKQARKMLKKLGHKMRGGEAEDVVPVPDDMKKAADSGATMGGRRPRGKKTARRGRSRSLFGMKY
jgi:hypothetical protein